MHTKGWNCGKQSKITNLIVKGTAVSALVWDSVDTNNQTYTIGDSALTLNAKATGGESGKPITYKLIAKKDGTETVKASATVAASATDSFSAPLRFTDTGSYECWFEATHGNVTSATTTFTMPASAVKIEDTYKDAPPSHTHSYGTDWKYDDTNHWHECECGDKADTAAHSFQWVIDKAATKEATKPFPALYRQHRGSVLVKDVNGAEGPAVDCQRFPVLLGRMATSVIIGVRLRDNGLRQTIADESLYPRPGDDIRTVLFSGVQLDCNLAGQPAADLIK